MKFKRLQNIQCFNTNQCFQVLACSSYQAAWGICGAILWLTRIHMLCKFDIILAEVIEVNEVSNIVSALMTSATTVTNNV